MDQSTYTNNITEAMSIIAQAEVAKVACDKTVTCTIIDDTNKAEGKYRVSDGSTEFYAYSDNTTYANNNVVYVTIPNGDYTQQKIITGKYTEDSDEPYVYTKPFDTFLPCSPNIVTNNQKVGLEANEGGDIDTPTSIGYWNKDQLNRYYKDFNRIGIQADFQSLLGQENIQKGDYGLALDIKYQVGQQEQYPGKETGEEYYFVNSLKGQDIQLDKYDLVIHEGEIFKITAECEVLEETEDWTEFYYNITFSSAFRNYNFTKSTNSSKISSEKWAYIIFNFDFNDIENVDIQLMVSSFDMKPACDLFIQTDSGSFEAVHQEMYDFGMQEFKITNESLLIDEYAYSCFNLREFTKVAAAIDQETGYDEDTYYTIEQTINVEEKYVVSNIKDKYKKDNYYKIPFIKDTNEYPTENRLYYKYDNKTYTKIFYKVISYLDDSQAYYDENNNLITLSEAYKGQYVYNIDPYYVYKPDTLYYIPEEYYIYGDNSDSTVWADWDKLLQKVKDEVVLSTIQNIINNETLTIEARTNCIQSYLKKYEETKWASDLINQIQKLVETEPIKIKTVLATENGFDSNKTYYSLNLVKLDINRDNYTSLVSNGQVGILNDNNNGLTQETLDKNFEVAKEKYGEIDWYKKTGAFEKVTIAKDTYESYLGKIYQKNDSGSCELVTDNGYDSTATYYYKTYQMVDVTDGDDVSEYYLRSLVNNSGTTTYKYIKNESTTAEANKQYYKKAYQQIAITKDQYKPGIFYIKENGEYSTVEDNGFVDGKIYYLPEYKKIEETERNKVDFDEGLYYYYYKYEFKESASMTNYNYYPITALAFDETIDYYDYNIFTNNSFVKANVTEENYEPNTYYSTKINYLTKTARVYLDTDEMLGQPYAYASPQTQEIVYDISDINDILSMSLSFYEDNQFYKFTGERYDPTGNNNLFVDNVKIYFGQDISDVDENNNDYVQLFTYDGDTYKATSNSAENNKTIYLKWLHREDDKNYVIDANNEAALFEDEKDKAVTKFEEENNCRPTENDDFEIRLDTSNDQIENRHYYIVNEYQVNDNDDKDTNSVLYTRSLVQNGALKYDASKEYYSLMTITYDERDEDTDIIVKSYASMSYTQVTDQTNLEPLRKYYRPCEAGGSYIYVGVGATVSLTEGDLYYQNYEEVTDNTTQVPIAYQVYRKLKSTDVKSMNANNRKYIYYSKLVQVENDVDLDNSTNTYYQRNYTRVDNTEGFVYSPSAYYYVSVDTEDVEIRWYRYELGAAAADEYSGVYWTRIDPKWDADSGKNAYLSDNFTLLLEPDAVYNETEKIKVIIIYGETTAVSNILEFTNESPVASLPTLQQENALRISYSDGTLGNYYVYGEDNQLLSQDEAQETRIIKLLFDLEDFTSSSLLTSAESVEWIFPTTNTMINVNTSLTAGVYSESNGVGTIKNTISDATEYSLAYTINGYYSYSLNNNTIVCNVQKDGVLYSTSAQFSFGQSGSNGTEYTLELDLQEPDGVVTIGGASSDEGLYYLTFGEVAKDNWTANSDIQLYNRIIDSEGYINYEPISIAEATAEGLDLLYAINTYTKVGYETPKTADYIKGNYDDKTYYYQTIETDKNGNKTADYEPIKKDDTIEPYISLKNLTSVYENEEFSISSSDYKTYLSNVFAGTHTYLEDWHSFTATEDQANNWTKTKHYWYTKANDTYTLVTDEVTSGTTYYIPVTEKSVDTNEIKQYYVQVENQAYSTVTRKYYRFDADTNTYIQTNVSKVGGDTTVVANLYDQNHQVLDIQSYPITWTWLTLAQTLFTIEENTYNSIILQQKSFDDIQEAMKEICILQASLTFGEVELTAYLPIPLRNNYAPVKFEGPTKIIYSTTGTPNYYKDAMKLYYNNEDGVLTEYSTGTFSIISSGNDETLLPTIEKEEKSDNGKTAYEVTLKAKSLYIDGIDPFAIQYEYYNKVIWTQPILYMQNRYFSSTLNKWDGELSVDNDNNTILAKSIAAGKKNDDNTFSGVIIGDWTDKTNANDSGQYVNSISDSNTTVLSDTTHTALGIYGINKGATSFGFTENGTGFIGKSGNGRIIFDGDNSLITSGNWFNNREGLYFDIDDGFILAQNDKGQYVKINAKASYDGITLNESNYIGDNFNNYFKKSKAIPKAGDDADNDYPFVIRGDDDNYTKIGWKGDLVLHGIYRNCISGKYFNDITTTTGTNGEITTTYNFTNYDWYEQSIDEDSKEVTYTKVDTTTTEIKENNYTNYYFDETSNGDIKYGISLSASARTYPLNIADHFATMWDGSLIISADEISTKYGADGKEKRKYTNVYGRGTTNQTIDTNIVAWEDLSGLAESTPSLNETEAEAETEYTVISEGLGTTYKKRYNYTNREKQLNGTDLIINQIYGYITKITDSNETTYGDFINEASIADSESASSSKTRSARNSNSYDYSQLNEDFEGFYATPYGDLYLSKKLVIGNNFSATRDGYLKATNALFDDCNADTFNVVYTDVYGRDAKSTLYNSNNITKKQYMSLVYGNPYYTPLAGHIGIMRGTPGGRVATGEYKEVTEDNFNEYKNGDYFWYYKLNDTKETYIQASAPEVFSTSVNWYVKETEDADTTLNVGIETKNDFGIKINSNTNISISARRSKIENREDAPDIKDKEGNVQAKLFSKTGIKNAEDAGGIYLTGRKFEVNTSQEINLISTYSTSYLLDYYNEQAGDSQVGSASSLPTNDIDQILLRLLNNLNITIQSDNFINTQSIGLKYEAGKYQSSGERSNYNSYPVDKKVLQRIYNEKAIPEVKINEDGTTTEDTDTYFAARSIQGDTRYFGFLSTTKDIDTSINAIPGYIGLKAGGCTINLRGYTGLEAGNKFVYDDGISKRTEYAHIEGYNAENLSLGAADSNIKFYYDDNGTTSKSTVKIQAYQLLGIIEKKQDGIYENNGRILLGVYGDINSTTEGELFTETDSEGATTIADNLGNRKKGYLDITSSASALWSGTQVKLQQGGDGGNNYIYINSAAGTNGEKNILIKSYNGSEIGLNQIYQLLPYDSNGGSQKGEGRALAIKHDKQISLATDGGIGFLSSVLYANALPQNQHGIYARFA